MSKETNPQIPIPAWFTDWLSDKKSDNGSEGGIVENSHGWGIALAVYRHLSPTGESAGRWVRCVDRLPDEGKEIVARGINSPTRTIIEREGIKLRDNNGNLYAYTTDPTIEWLDESPSQPSAGMVDLLKWVNNELAACESHRKNTRGTMKQFHAGAALAFQIVKDRFSPTPTKTEGQ